MELRHLRAFAILAEELHFGRAASRLNIVQPALSMQIRNLEEELGVQLLERTRRMVALTGPGHVFLEEVRRTLAHVERGVIAARRAARGEIGQLTIGYSGGVAYSGLLSRLVRDFRRQVPEVELAFRDLHPALQRTALAEGDIDLGLVAASAPDDQPGLESRLVERWNLSVVLPADHPLAAQETIPLALLRDETFVSYTALGEDLGVDMVRIAGHFAPRIAHTAESPAMLLSLVAAGLGIAIVPQALARIDMAGVIFRPAAEKLPEVPVRMLWRVDAIRPVLARFLDIVPAAG